MNYWKWVLFMPLFLVICIVITCGDDDDDSSGDVDDHNDDTDDEGNDDNNDTDDDGNDEDDDADDDVDDDDLDDDDDADDDDDNTEFSCDVNVCIDPLSGLMWQNDSSPQMGYHLAKSYCLNSDWGGYSGWRLPSISELRSLIRGCPDTETGGSCGLMDSCLNIECRDSSCNGCAEYGGPGPGGAYWPQVLSDSIDYYWSSSCSTSSSNCYSVHFGDASLNSHGTSGLLYVRCVRSKADS